MEMRVAVGVRSTNASRAHGRKGQWELPQEARQRWRELDKQKLECTDPA